MNATYPLNVIKMNGEISAIYDVFKMLHIKIALDKWHEWHAARR